MDNRQLPVFELKIEDENQDGVFAVSLVDSPAIMREFILQSEEKQTVKFQAQKEKRTATGALLIPNQLIYRIINNQECFVFYTAETIEKIRNNFFKNQFTKKVNVEHSAEEVEGVFLIESWLTTDKPGKEFELGLTDLPSGSWVGTYYFDFTAEELFTDFVKSGILKGFSIEGLFALSPTSTVQIQQEDEYSKLLKELEILLK